MSRAWLALRLFLWDAKPAWSETAEGMAAFFCIFLLPLVLGGTAAQLLGAFAGLEPHDRFIATWLTGAIIPVLCAIAYVAAFSVWIAWCDARARVAYVYEELARRESAALKKTE